MAKRLVSLTVPIVGYINATVEIDIPDSITDQTEAQQWVLDNYTTKDIVDQDTFDTCDVSYDVDTEDNDNLCCLDVDLDEDLL
jgi:hypothetical protein